MLQNKVSVDMVSVDNPTNMPDADKEDAIVVAVTRDGGVFLGQNRLPSISWRHGSRQARRQAWQDDLLCAPMRARR